MASKYKVKRDDTVQVIAGKDKGNYIHNGLYVRQLLFDSIIDMGGTPLFGAP